MANLGATFDAASVEPNAPLDPLPPGEYRVQILQSEMRATKAGTGQLLWLDMEVLEAPLQGRHVYDRLNLINPNPTTEEIAQRTLSAICHAIGKLLVTDTEELHLQPMLARVVLQANGYNDVKGYKPVNDRSPATPAKPARSAPAAAAPTAPAPSPAAANRAAAPWARST